jgi:aldose 1-epimerase
MSDAHEIELVCGEWSAVVSAFGASLRGAMWRGAPVVTGYRGAGAKQGGQGDVLIPFAGRVKGGRYTWDGVTHQLPLTDKDGPNAIHGFVRSVPWTVELTAPHAAAFALRFAGADGYPFPLDISVAYALDAHGLHVDSAITNAGSTDAPVAMGFHPYFTVGSDVVNDDHLTLPFSDVLEFEQLIPTGKVFEVAVADLDFRAGAVIGETVFNHCFGAPERDEDGLARVRLSNGSRALVVWMDEAYDYAVLYTGEALPDGLRRRSLAIEPMSGATDSLNHHQWGLHRLAPGDTFAGRWGVRCEPPT